MSQGRKYLVVGGYVRSRSDDDLHYVGARRLVELYGLKLSECVLRDESTPRMLGDDLDGLIVLGPRYDGNYELPCPATSGKSSGSLPRTVPTSSSG